MFRYYVNKVLMNVNRSNNIEDIIRFILYPYIRNIKFCTTYFVINKCSKITQDNTTTL